MKSRLLYVFMVLVISMSLILSNIQVFAAGHNLCEDDVTVTWSGTWCVPGTEGTNNPGTNLIDGDYSNKWGSNDIRVTGEEWVQITFKKPVDIGGFYVYQEASGAYTNIGQYTIQVQNGTSEWTVAYTSDKFSEFWTEDGHDFKTPVKATALRFHCTSDQALPGTATEPNRCAIELSEIEIYEATAAVVNPTQGATQAAQQTGASSSASANTSASSSPAKSPTNSAANASKSPQKSTSPSASSPKEDKNGNGTLVIIISAGVVVVVAALVSIYLIKKNKK